MKIYKLKKEQTPTQFKIDYAAELNEQQLNIVLNTSKHSLVLAGPGSGKTRVLVYKVARLIEEGVKPDRILLLTFTNKAARNMMSRVETLLGSNPQGLVGGTFHHVGSLLLRKHARSVGFNNNFSIIDNEDSKQIIKDIIAALYPKKEKHFPNTNVIFSIISFSRNTLLPIKACVEKKYPYDLSFAAEIGAIAQQYEQRKLRSNVLDFDDLLVLWNKLLDNRELCEQYARKFSHILVDEFQDTNKIQFEIIKKLVSPESSIMAVGDDCQSVYSFRGAEIKNILDFPQTFKDTKELRLELNYRSTPQIIELINASIENNKEQFKKQLKPLRAGKDKPTLVRCKDEQQESEFIGQRILDLKEEGLSYNDIGVLFRAEYQSAALELELMKRGIPYKKRGGLRFFEQAHVKDLTSFLKLFSNARDELAWKRILTLFEGIGDTTVQRIWDTLSKQSDPINFARSTATFPTLPSKASRGWADFRSLIGYVSSPATDATLVPGIVAQLFIEKFYKRHLQDTYPNFKDRLLDVNQYANLANQYTSMEKFLEDILLEADLTSSEKGEHESDESVTLSTIHQAKGLEWPSVFVISLAQGRFPLERASRDDSLEEERRLFYVACSRAKDELYLTVPMEENTFWGGFTILPDSLFIEELSKTLYEEWTLREEVSDNEESDVFFTSADKL